MHIKLEVKDNIPFVPSETKNAIPDWSKNIPKATTLPSAPIEIEDEVLVIDEEPEALEETFVTNEDDGDELGNDDFLLEDTSRRSWRNDPPQIVASDFVSKPMVNDAPRELGEAALRDEAKSLQHLMCHTPKNPFSETCNRAKMYKYPSRQKSGEPLKSRLRSLADHLITSDDREVGIDQSKVALVIRDVATDFRDVCPATRKTSQRKKLQRQRKRKRQLQRKQKQRQI